jgi:pimeloyl-ACP methyl ester carboxylesterase
MTKSIKLLKFSILAMIILVACSHEHIRTNTYVMVHGAWQGPWVWDKVQQALEKSGNRVVVVELPAHGNDSTSPAVVSVNVYRDRVLTAMQGLPGKVILVGHSLGGVVVSAVAEAVPDKIAKLVYIAAFVPASGQSLLDLAAQDKQSILGPNIIPSENGLTLGIVTREIVPIFCQDASTATQQLMLSNYRSEPAIPFADKAVLTGQKFGRVKKYYIHTLLDQAIGIDNQIRMADSAHITNIYSLNTGHSPFLSKPDQVTGLLLQIAE